MTTNPSEDPFEKIAANIVQKSGANLLDEHYLKWVARTVREAVNDEALKDIQKSQRFYNLKDSRDEYRADRDRIWDALVKLAGDPDKARELIGGDGPQ